jgi:hypothetical protein
MRTLRGIVQWGCLVLVSLMGLTYVTDDLWSRFRRRPVEQIKVDRIYAAVNHFNRVEYSIGTPVIETCIDALMPHFGYTPCWYLRRHTIRQIGPYY